MIGRGNSKMLSNLKAFSTRLLCFSLSLSILCPLKAQSISPVLEKDFRRDATEKVQIIVNVYNKARIEFEKKGAQAFVDQINRSAPKALTETESHFLAKKVAREQMLPVLKIKGDTLFAYEGKKEVFALNTYDIIQGNFNFPKQKLIYNSDKRMIENYEAWTNKKSKFFSSSIFERLFLNVESLFVPQAQAFTPMMGALIGLILGGLAGFFVGKYMAHKKAQKEAQAQALAAASATPITHNAGGVTTAAATTTTPTGNPALPLPETETPAEGTVDAGAAAAAAAGAGAAAGTAAAGAGDAGTAAGGTPATPAPASGTTTTPTPPSTPEQDLAAAEDFINTRYPAHDVNSLDHLKEEQTTQAYLYDACQTLKKVKTALNSTDPKKKMSPAVGKILVNALVFNKDGKRIVDLNYVAITGSEGSTYMRCSTLIEELLVATK